MNTYHPSQSAATTSPRPPQKKRLLCLWLPNWPIQRIQAVEPQLAKSPLLLTTRDARRGMVVSAANLNARSQGVRAGMRLSEATTLVDPVVRDYEPDEDVESLRELAEQAQQFSPLVGIEQLDKQLWHGRTLHYPEAILLDVTGIASMFGGELPLLQGVSNWLNQQRIFACMAIGKSIGAAWALANYQTRTGQVAVLPAETALVVTADGTVSGQGAAPEDESSGNVPHCRYVISGDDEGQLLQCLPLAALRLSSPTISSLYRLGIRTIGELERLPRSGMATRLGSELMLRWDQAFSRCEETFVALNPEPEFSSETTLDIPTEQIETIVELIRRLASELCQRLAKRDAGALRVICRIDFVERSPLVMQLSLFRPTNEVEYLHRLLQGQIEQYSRDIVSPVYRIAMQVPLVGPMRWRQSDLFDEGDADIRNQIARLADTLSNRIGRKRVLYANVRHSSQPENSAWFHPVTGRTNHGLEKSTVRKLSSRIGRQRAEPSRNDPLTRPTMLFAKPIAIEVSGTSSEARVKLPEGWVTVAESVGPERLESGWWKGPSVRRDYYRIVTTHGAWWWIFRDLQDNRWYLHGHFD